MTEESAADNDEREGELTPARVPTEATAISYLEEREEQSGPRCGLK